MQNIDNVMKKREVGMRQSSNRTSLNSNKRFDNNSLNIFNELS